MSTFEERKQASEAQYHIEQELEFRTVNRRNKLLGLWAAELMGKDGNDAEAYAKDVVKSDFDRPGDDDVLEKVAGDFKAHNVELSDHRLRKKMDELLVVARDQVWSETRLP